MSSMNTPSATANGFATTHWSVILAANGQETTGVLAALETLFRTYQKPLYWYIRYRAKSHHEAEDLLQGFFGRVVAKEVLRAASQERGRFRSFLLTSLKNYLANEHDRAVALKRGGAEMHLPLDPNLDAHTVQEPSEESSIQSQMGSSHLQEGVAASRAGIR